MSSERTILVSCFREEKAPPYVAALGAVGVREERIRLVMPHTTSPDEGRELAREAAGLLLCGGADVDPALYGEEPHPHANLEIVAERDALEWALLDGVRESGTPTFAVCRGMQVVNAYLGGTLWQDLKLMWPGSLLHDLSYPRDALVHNVTVSARDTRLGEILASEQALVNSRHHQSVKELTDELLPVASAPDRIVEAAIGRQPDWWLWCVQWHPENLVALRLQHAIWDEFARVVAARSVPSRESVGVAAR